MKLGNILPQAFVFETEKNQIISWKISPLIADKNYGLATAFGLRSLIITNC